MNERGIETEVIEYLKAPPSAAELEDLLAKLGLPARDIVRANEPEFKTSGASLDAPDADLVALVAEHPKLLQRPIVEAGDAARIGRPPEAVLELFE